MLNNKKTIFILSDIPFENGFANKSKTILSEKFNICYICTFADDEPYMELIKAVSELKDVQVFITGNYESVKLNPDDYKHVAFTGFISTEVYRSLLSNVNAVITLTKRENTMQRAGSEAVSAGKPLITSDTEMLRNYFTKGTVFVDNTPQGIVEGIIKLKNNYHLYSSEILQFQKNRRTNFTNKLEEVKKHLELT